MRRLALLALSIAALASCKSSSGTSEVGSNTPAPATKQPAQSPPAAGSAAPALEVGSVAPDFSLPGSDGKVHRLADDRGKHVVVVAWYPKAFTGG